MTLVHRFARVIVRLYPRSWRERYGPEVSALIEDSPPGFRDVFDLGRGCGGAWLHGTELGAWIRGLGGLLTAVVASAAPAFVFGRGLRQLGWTNEMFAVVSVLPTMALASRVVWLNRVRWLSHARPPVFCTTLETPWWRVAAFAGAVLFFASDAAVRPLAPFPVLAAFAPPVTLGVLVDCWAASPWFIERRAHSRPDVSAGPLGLN